jgi:hypothetical protein
MLNLGNRTVILTYWFMFSSLLAPSWQYNCLIAIGTAYDFASKYDIVVDVVK